MTIDTAADPIGADPTAADPTAADPTTTAPDRTRIGVRRRHGVGALLVGVLIPVAMIAPSASAAVVPGDLAVVAGPPSPNAVSSPMGVATDAAGDVYIADTGNDVVEELTPAGAFSVVAGEYRDAGTPGATGTAVDEPLDGPTGIFVDAHGDLFIADTGNAAVEEVTPGGTMTVVAGTPGTSGTPVKGAAATATRLGAVTGVATDAAGDLFIADPTNSVVEQVRQTTLTVAAGRVGMFGSPAAGPVGRSKLETPEGVAVDGHGDLFIADAAAAVVEEVAGGDLSIVAGDGASSSTVTPGPATGTALGTPQDVAVDPAGDVLVADSSDAVVEEVTGGQLRIAAGLPGNADAATPGPAADSAVGTPVAVATDAAGDVLIADPTNSQLDEVAPAVVPPPALPETPVGVLPGAAAALIAGAFVLVRRRRGRH